MSTTSPSVFSVDMYIISLGALGLLFVFSTLFLELAGKDSLTGRVWFECTWTSTSFVTNLTGALALSAIVPRQFCSTNSSSTFDACNSTRVLLAFSWITALVFLMYSTTLLTFALLLRGEHPTVWSFNVRHLPSPTPKHALSSEPPSPILPRITEVPILPSIVAPMPRPMMSDPEVLYSRSHGLGLEHMVDQHEPPVLPQPNHAAKTASRHQAYPSTLYPQFVQSTLQVRPEIVRAASSKQRPPSPPPLGDWPRPDVLTRPVRSKRPKHYTRIPETSTHSISTSRSFGPRDMRTGRDDVLDGYPSPV
ncbi:hypothetical protein APHAL10511_001257 [Amanita phalloides]|nr:hypothetical protein APHAL10511_001257 [Amanita phalloides]